MFTIELSIRIFNEILLDLLRDHDILEYRSIQVIKQILNETTGKKNEMKTWFSWMNVGSVEIPE